jgi:hypothetical protein
LAPLVPHAGVGAALILPHVNTHAMNLHLKEISTQVMPGAHAVITLDGAGWHQQGDKSKGPEKHQPLAAAALLAGIEPSRKYLAVPQAELLGKSHLRHLRGTRRCML